jgi:hypothetical protein
MRDEREEQERTYNILVYGIEKYGLTAPAKPLAARNFSISFEPFNTIRRFNEYDGVILFQGIFEHFEWKSGLMDRYLAHSCAKDELDKRKKEAHLLIESGGFLCFLLNTAFVDREDGRDYTGTDLAKYHLSYSDFYRENFGQRIAHVDIKSDDFRKFLSVYGAASSHFHHYNKHIDWRVLAEAAGRVVGMIINRNQYFLPTLIPDNRPEVIKEYFSLLVEGLTSSYNKLQHSFPEWIEDFNFDEEAELVAEREALGSRISEIEKRRGVLSQYKSVLALSGDELVASVREVFVHGFGIAVDAKDELREDFKILDETARPICLCEVKGTNRGVKREYINQADSHRERANFGAEFPALLIINTHVKNARSVTEKDQEIADEQVQHAVKMNVLIIRTIDLLALLRIYLSGKLSSKEIEELVTNNSGWLRVSGDKYTVVTNHSPAEKPGQI